MSTSGSKEAESQHNLAHVDMHSEPQSKIERAWWRRSDVQLWLGGMLFIAILMGMMFAVGSARQWYAPSGYEHEISITSSDRFLPEPCENDTYVNYTNRYGSSVGDLRGRWYYWQLKPWEVSMLTRLFVWLCYAGHQISVWLVIYLAQLHKSEQAAPKYSTQISRYNVLCFVLNVIFHLLHLLQTHITYDGLAQDVAITSSQCSVIMLLVLASLMHYTERGLFFGWPTIRHKDKISSKLRLKPEPIYVVRKYHGYAFAWAAIYTFWYHPMENTYGHALGFLHTWMFLLQASLMYTDFHKVRWWRFIQEVWVTVHGGLVAYQTGGPDMKGTTLWPMFFFGFLWQVVLTQIFLLSFWNHEKCPAWLRVIPSMLCLALTLGAFSWIPDAEGRTWTRLPDIIRIPAIEYLCLVFAWALMLLFVFIERKMKGTSSEKSAPISKVKQGVYICAFLLCYAIMVGLSAFVQLGGVNIMMFISMVSFLFLFIILSCLSIMFVRQIVPAYKIGQKNIGGSEDGIIKDDKKLESEGKLGYHNPAHQD